MIHEFTTKDMSDLLYNDLSTIQDNEGKTTEIALTTPTTESVFPCRILETPLETTNKTNNGIPILKTFQVSIEHWDNEQRFCMEMANRTDKQLQKRNFTRTNSSPIIFDQITKKYKFITNYEVHYNAIMNSFSCIK
ncbi:MAG: hypothetical protein UE116_06390 [Clostridia bacterium]|jgi:hypothetical protein|nr:hypothetical protein [Clostridia bacterium]